MSDPKFTIVAKVSGTLGSSFVFENRAAYNNWMKTGFVALQKKYGKLNVSVDTLPGLKVGDECNVWGEAQDVFVITKLERIGDHRWAFCLNSGWREEVAKCHTSHLPRQPSARIRRG